MNKHNKILVGLIITILVCLSNITIINVKADENNEFEYIISNNEVSITGYKGQNQEVVIPSYIEDKPVTTIEDKAFYNKYDVINIEIPSTITKISPKAFELCRALNQINVAQNNTVYSSEDGMLYNKDKTVLIVFPKARDSIDISESVTDIGNYAFCDSANIEHIQLPENLKTIGEYAFKNCSKLTGLKIPESVTTIGTYAFYNCRGILRIQIPKGIAQIEEGVFFRTGVRNVEIPSGVRSIGANAFAYDTRLGSIKIPNTVTRIGSGALSFTYLGSIEIPSSVSYIDKEAFYHGTTIYGKDGSYVERYTKKEDYKFISFSEREFRPYKITIISVLIIASVVALYKVGGKIKAKIVCVIKSMGVKGYRILYVLLSIIINIIESLLVFIPLILAVNSLFPGIILRRHETFFSLPVALFLFIGILLIIFGSNYKVYNSFAKQAQLKLIWNLVPIGTVIGVFLFMRNIF